MTSTPAPLGQLAEVDTPELVKPAFRRFRRQLFAVLALVAVAAALVGFVAGRPHSQSPRDLMLRAEQRHLISRPLSQGDLSVLVLDAARVGPRTYGVHLVASAENLSTDQALDIHVPINTLIPAPGEEDDLGGLRMQTGGEIADSGYGAGTHVIEAWILIPTGTTEVPIEFRAGVPLNPTAPPPAATPGEDAVPSMDHEAAEMPPTTPGSAQTLGSITIRVDQLGVPKPIWSP